MTKGKPSKYFIHQVLEMAREGPSDPETREKEAPNLVSHRGMNKKMTTRLPCHHTQGIFIRQIPTSIMEMIKGDNFIQVSIP